MLVRKATLDDALGIASVHVRSWQETYKGIIKQNFLDQLIIEERVHLWEQTLKNPQSNAPIYVAENEEGEIIGFASFGYERTKRFGVEGELYAIYIY